MAQKPVRNIKLGKCELGVKQAECNVTSSRSSLWCERKILKVTLHIQTYNLYMFTLGRIQQKQDEQIFHISTAEEGFQAKAVHTLRDH